jgi:amino acid adenylation domain-containing protein
MDRARGNVWEGGLHGATPLLHDYLLHAARRLPDKVGLVAAGRRLTYGQLDADSNALAHELQRRGVERGDRVLIYAGNVPEAVVAFWAALKANAVASVINPGTKKDKLAYLIADSRPAALVAEARLHRELVEPAASPHLRTVVLIGQASPKLLASVPSAVAMGELLAAGRRDTPPPRSALDIDLASIIYTSGSTGDPKGVMLTHRNMLSAATSVGTYLETEQDDVLVSVLPLSFDYGLYQMIMGTRWGARVVLERSFAYPVKVLETLEREQATGFPGVPTMFSILAGMSDLDRYDFSTLRFVSNTAAALTDKHVAFIRSAFPTARLFSMYGLTECKRCTYLPPADIDRKPGSVGIAIPNTELWLVGEDGERVGPGEVGELVIRGATVMKGYWEKPEATAKRLRAGPLPGEQVLHTGDLCRLDEDGYLYFVSRMDDIIKSRGEKVAPKAVENVLMSMDGIREAAVIGVEDPVLGQAIKAFVVLEGVGDVTERAIQRHCQSHLEPFMVPQKIELVPDLPKTTSGKIKKTGLA